MSIRYTDREQNSPNRKHVPAPLYAMAGEGAGVLLAISDISIPASDSDNLPYEKVGKNEPVCIADEVPFDIPDTWEWVRLGEIYQHNTGKALNASNRSGELLTYITTSNLYWNRFEIDSLREMYCDQGRSACL